MGNNRNRLSGSTLGNTEAIEKLMGQVADLKRRCCCGGAFGVTTLDPPVAAPGTNDPTWLGNLTTGGLWYWNGASWVAAGVSTNLKLDHFGVTMTSAGVGTPIAVETMGFVIVPYAGTITGVTIIETSYPAAIPCNVIVEAYITTYANYQVSETEIFNTDPEIIADFKVQNLAPDLAVTTVAAGDIVRFRLRGNDVAENLLVSIHITKD